MFDFTEAPEGWEYVTIPAAFSPATGAHAPQADDSFGELRITTTNNDDNFGFWYSPLLTVNSFFPGLSQDDAINTPSLVRARWTVTTDLADTTAAPQFRLRQSSTNNEQDDVLVIESNDGATSGPASTDPAEYDLYFVLPENALDFRLAFDVLNFNPADAATARVGLDRVVVDLYDESVLTSGTLLYSADFVEGPEGWTALFPPDSAGFIDPIATYDELSGDGAFGALSLQNVGADPGFTVFGWWNSPEAPGQRPATLAVDQLLYARFRVGTEVLTQEQVPMFRLRMNESGFHAAQYLKANSTGDLPVNVPKAFLPPLEYTVFFPPNIGVGNYLIMAFDLVTNPATDGDDVDGVVYLDSVDVYTLPLELFEND